MRHQKLAGLVAVVFLFTLLLTVSSRVGGQEKGKSAATSAAKASAGASAKVVTHRKLAMYLASVERARVLEGGIIRLYTEKQAKEREAEQVEHKRRYDEFRAKRDAIRKRKSEIEAKMPTRYFAFAERSFQSLDRDGDGRVLVKESRRSIAEADANDDGTVSRTEYIHWTLTRQLGSIGGAFGQQGTATEKTAEITVKDLENAIKESAKLADREKALRVEYGSATSRRSASTYYRIVEASAEFLRLRSKTEERVIPYSSIKEFRRQIGK